MHKKSKIPFQLSSAQLVLFAADTQADAVPVVFVEPNGTEKQVQAEIGKSLLDVAHENNVELEGKPSCQQ